MRYANADLRYSGEGARRMRGTWTKVKKLFAQQRDRPSGQAQLIAVTALVALHCHAKRIVGTGTDAFPQ